MVDGIPVAVEVDAQRRKNQAGSSPRSREQLPVPCCYATNPRDMAPSEVTLLGLSFQPARGAK